MRYVRARLFQETKDEAYRIYITDSLKAFGGFSVRYADLFKPEVKEERTSEEIITQISGKIAALGGG